MPAMLRRRAQLPSPAKTDKSDDGCIWWAFRWSTSHLYHGGHRILLNYPAQVQNMSLHDEWSDCEPEYEVETFTIQDYIFHILTVVPPPLEYMSKLHSNQQEISGRQIWCGSALLCNYILSNPSIVHNKRTLELGSGTGIVGMLAFRLSRESNAAKCVCLSDGDMVAIDLLLQNLSNKDNQIDRNVCDGRQLLWGCGTEDEKHNSEFEQWCIDKWPNLWVGDEAGSGVKFDLMLAGDVLYKPFLPSLFFSSVDRYLAKDGVLYLCHIPRNHVYQELVIDAAAEAGFTVELLQMDITDLPEGCPLSDAERAAIYRIRRRP